MEYIEGLGWTAELEFEGKDPQKANTAIQQALKVLDVPNHKVTHKPISAIYLENRQCGRANGNAMQTGLAVAGIKQKGPVPS